MQLWVDHVFCEVDGVDQLVFVMTDEVIAIDPRNGLLFWSFPLENQWSLHVFAPVWDAASQTLFVSSFRQSHALRMQRDEDQVAFEKQWSIDRTGIGFTNAVVTDGIVYGSTGGSRSAVVTAIDLSEGERLWRERGFAVSNYLAVGDRLVLLDENGVLGIAHPNRSALNVVTKQQILNAPKAWTVPTMVGERLYVRDQKEIVACALK